MLHERWWSLNLRTYFSKPSDKCWLFQSSFFSSWYRNKLAGLLEIPNRFEFKWCYIIYNHIEGFFLRFYDLFPMFGDPKTFSWVYPPLFLIYDFSIQNKTWYFYSVSYTHSSFWRLFFHCETSFSWSLFTTLIQTNAP